MSRGGFRRDRLRLEGTAPEDAEQALAAVTAAIERFRGGVAAMPLDLRADLALHERDFRADPLWTRVDGKALLRALSAESGPAALRGRDLESELFRACKTHGPPEPLVLEIERVLSAIARSRPS